MSLGRISFFFFFFISFTVTNIGVGSYILWDGECMGEGNILVILREGGRIIHVNSFSSE